jgi:hypothetical protein
MVYNIAWDETQPDGSEAANTLDTEIQELKESIRERLEDVIDDWTVDGTDPKTLNGAAFSAGDITYAARANERAVVRLNSSEEIADDTTTAIPWDTELLDVGGLVDLGAQPTRITIVNTGFYMITGGVLWFANPTGQREILIRLDGAGDVLAGATTTPANTVTFRQSISVLATLTAGTYVELTARQTSTAPLNITATPGTQLTIVRLA